MKSLPFSFDRRRFLKLAAAGAASASLAGPLVGCGSTAIEPTGEVLIIGSGFGGAISALRLAEAGITSTVLERGMRWEITEERDTFASMSRPDRRATWLGDRSYLDWRMPRFEPYTGLLERVHGDNVNVIVGAGVGGSSLAYAAIFIQPPRDLFESLYPSEIPYAELDATYFPRVREVMGFSSIPDDILGSEPYLATRIFLDHAERSGLEASLIENAIDWDIVRAELAGELPAEAILGEYIYGMNSGAKGSTDRTYLARAEATGLVDVRPLHQVASIAEVEGGYQVEVERLDTSGQVIERMRLRTSALILAAGSIGSTKLLLRARRDGGLPRLSSEVGEGWGNNGQYLLMRTGLSEETGAYQGGPACAYIHDHDNPIGPIGIEHGAAPFGFEHHCLINPSSGIPDSFGRVILNEDGEAQVELPEEAYQTAREAADYTAARQCEVAGGTASVFNFGSPNVFHPLGGAVMGRVCDTFGRVEGHPGLYVIDGALLPGVVPVANPAWTISALAERAIEAVIREDLSPESET